VRGENLKIRKVRANNRKRVFVVHSDAGAFEFPYAQAQPAPSPEDPLERVYVDPELGNEGFTWILRSGQEGALHLDTVLGYNEDPAYMGDIALYHLSRKVEELVESSGMAKREIARRLRTSPSQLYRLMDPTNPSKSMRQVLALLHVLGYEVRFEVRKREAGATA
jgi:hypothetical protein